MTQDVPVRAQGPGGYSLPLSPRGLSSMLTPPPWHFAGDVVMVEAQVDPAAAAAFLPPGLEPGPRPGAAAFVFADWTWCSDDGRELDDPGACRFGEFLILLACAYRGRALARCPYAWVDHPVPMMRGWLQGMPKQPGDIAMTMPRRVGRTGPRPGGPGRYAGSLSAGGRRVVDLVVDATEPEDQRPALHDVPLVHSRWQSPWLDSELAAAPDAVDDHLLMTSLVEGVEFSGILRGTGEIRFASQVDPDLASLAPISVGRGYVFGYAETLVGGRLLG